MSTVTSGLLTVKLGAEPAIRCGARMSTVGVPKSVMVPISGSVTLSGSLTSRLPSTPSPTVVPASSASVILPSAGVGSVTSSCALTTSSPRPSTTPPLRPPSVPTAINRLMP